MAEIQLTLMRLDGTSLTAGIPDDVPVSKLLPKLVAALKLPTVSPYGQPVSYKLYHKNASRMLNDNETLKSAHVVPKDMLRVETEIIPGRPTMVAAGKEG